MPYTKLQKMNAIEFFIGKPIVQDGMACPGYDGRDDRVAGIRCPDTNARIIYLDSNTHIRYINRILTHNYISMRNMTGYYERRRRRADDRRANTERLQAIAEREEKEYVEYMVECELKTYEVDETEECPICYNHYGEQEDGTFLCKDGTSNSSRYKKKCTHHCCVKCIKEMAEENKNTFQGKCPLCRESWAGWLQLNYSNSVGYENPISCFEAIAV